MAHIEQSVYIDFVYACDNVVTAVFWGEANGGKDDGVDDED